MNAVEKIASKNKDGKIICVGLDTDKNKIPVHLKNSSNPVLEFNRAIIEATAPHAAAFKINFAFYESDGIEGWQNLRSTIPLIPKDTLIIADAKRGDIGNTSEMYAKAVFEYFNCDAVTINPYLGEDSVKPFLNYSEKLCFILALTSNKGSADFEKLKLEDGSRLFQKIIDNVIKWNEKNNCGIVFGATQIEDLKENIKRFGSLPVLLPGVGAQGGSLEDVAAVFKNNNRLDLLVNVSRGIIYKSPGKDFAAEASSEIVKLNKIVSDLFVEEKKS